MKWLTRNIGAPGPYLCLCLSKSDYQKAMRHLKIKNPPRWVRRDFNATLHWMIGPHGPVAVVCLKHQKTLQHEAVIGLLIHEAVHIWQSWRKYYGETTPGDEHEAYSIQSIAQNLIEDFMNQTKQRKKSSKH